MTKLVQSISSTGIIHVQGQAATFSPDISKEGEGTSLLAIRIRPETLKLLEDQRVTIVIYPAINK